MKSKIKIKIKKGWSHSCRAVNAYPGWNIDDVVISGDAILTPTVYYADATRSIDRQEGFSGPIFFHVEGAATGILPTGGLGGDDTDRQFAVFDDGLIHEFDALDTNTVLAGITPPATDIEGMAFDGTWLYISTASGNLYTLDADTGEVQHDVSVPDGALFGLGAVSRSGELTNLLLNGGFETGNFTGWTAITNGLEELTPWTVGSAGGGWFSDTSPLQGTYSAYNGFDGAAGLEYELYQDVAIPAGRASTLFTNHRIVFDSLGSGGQDRIVELTVRDTNNNVRRTLFTQNVTLDFFTDLGWDGRQFDLSEFAGQTIRVHFSELIPESFTGPANIEFDGIQLLVESGPAVINPEIDEYTLDLTGRAGRSVDVILSGQSGVDFSDQLLELLDADGTTVLATALPDPLGVEADNYDLAILDFVIPASAIYTLRLTSNIDGQYGIVLADSLVFDTEPNDALADTLRPLDDVGGALGFLGSAPSARLFAVDAITSEIVELDPLSGVELNRLPLPEPATGGPDALAFDGTSLFFGAGSAFDGGNVLYELDPDTGTVIDTDPFSAIGLSSGIDGLGVFGGLIIASDTLTSEVFFVDSDSDAVVGSWLAPRSIRGGAAGAGARQSIFVNNFLDSLIFELDAATGAVVNTLDDPLGTSTLGLAFVDGMLLLGGADRIVAIDPDTGEILSRFDTTAVVSALGGDDPTGVPPFVNVTTAEKRIYKRRLSGQGNSSTDNGKPTPSKAGMTTSSDSRGVIGRPSTAYAAIPGTGVRVAPRSPQLRGSDARSVEAIEAIEVEPNDTLVSANPISLGFAVGENAAVDVLGSLMSPPDPTAQEPFAEDDGSIPLASDTALTAGVAVVIRGAMVGDGPHGFSGSGSGDFDFYRVTASFGGQLISVDIDTPSSSLDSYVAIYDSVGELLAQNDDDLFSLDSFLQFSTPAAGEYFISVGGFGSFALDDPFDSSSGPGAASEGEYDVTIGLDHGDIDSFRIELNAGDVLGANVSGQANAISLRDAAGTALISSREDVTLNHPDASPLPGGGNAALSWVIDTPGTYYVTVSNGLGEYSLNLRLFRPPFESQLLGSQQTLFLDFDGATIDTSIFGGFGDVALSPLAAFLPNWGLDEEADLNAVIDAITATVEENLSDDIRLHGNNGDFGSTGIAGQFDIEILNSRDHADPFGMSHVSRVIIGGTSDELGIFTFGAAQSIDVGNFDSEETAVVLLDRLSRPQADFDSLNQYELAPSVSIIDLIGVGVGNLASREAGHLVGNWSTDALDAVPNIMDQVVNLDNNVGVGPDRIFGSGDDVDVDFGDDTLAPFQGVVGVQDTLNTAAFGMSTGTTDPALVGAQVVAIDPAGGVTEDLSIVAIAVEFSEPIARPTAQHAGNYQLLNAGPNAIFEEGGGDDVIIPLTPIVSDATRVELQIAPEFAPLFLGSYQLTLRGDDSGIIDLDGNPLNTTTGPGGGSPFVHRFDVVFEFEPGGDLYQIDLEAGQLVLVRATALENSAVDPGDPFDPKLVIIGPRGIPVAEDLNSWDGKNAEVSLIPALTGTYAIQVLAESGQGEYQLDVSFASSQPITIRIEDAVVVRHAGLPATAEVDVFVEFFGAPVEVVGYEARLDLGTTSGLTFAGVEQSSPAHPPLFPRQHPGVVGTPGINLQVTDFLPIGSGTFPLEDQAGLFRVLIEVPGDVAGSFEVTFDPSFTGLVDPNGDFIPISLQGGTIDVIEDNPPAVTELLVGSTAWDAAFLEFLQAEDLGGGGYTVPVGSGDQLLPLPWINIDQLLIRFSEDVSVQATNLQVQGIGTATYEFRDFHYDSDMFLATWTLDLPTQPDGSIGIQADQLRITLNDAVTDVLDLALDGEWHNPQDTAVALGDVFPSGDGLPGGDFVFHLNVLPGDVDQSGGVRVSDTIKTRNRQFTGTSDAQYAIFHDVNGDGRIRISDIIKVRNRQFTQLPVDEVRPEAADAMFEFARRRWYSVLASSPAGAKRDVDYRSWDEALLQLASAKEHELTRGKIGPRLSFG